MVKPYEPLYTVSEAAKILKVNVNDVYNLINTGQIPCLILGRKKIRGSDLERFIEKYPTEEVKKDGKQSNACENGALAPAHG